MSKKRTSAESNDDEQQNESSDSLFQQGNNAKLAKLASSSDTTLHDLPMELIEFILIKVITMEVKGMKLAKSVWKQKADLVINRLGAVCSYWSSIFTTNFFRNELHRTLDTTDQQKIRLEIVLQTQIPFFVYEVTTLNDDMFMICSETRCIIVYNRNNMARLNDISAPPGQTMIEIASCNVSNCVYVLSQDANDHSVSRMTKDEDHQFNIAPWINNIPSLPVVHSISTSANGSLIVLSWRIWKESAEASIYDTNGFLQHKIIMPSGVFGFEFWNNTILKSNGNLVLVPCNDQGNTELLEIDATGRVERTYKTSAGVHNGINFADTSGRYVITEWDYTLKLLDSELNLLDFTGPQLYGSSLHYNSERNEIVSVLVVGYDSSVLTIFRFTEE